MDEFALLETIGYTVQTIDHTLRIRLPDGSTTPSVRHERLRHMSGRLSNIAYMANEMDRLDGVQASDAERSISGARQFQSLLQNSKPSALVYFALRRLQRRGDVPALRRGLAILLAFDHSEIDGEDAVAHFVDVLTGPDEAGLSFELALEAPAARIAAR